MKPKVTLRYAIAVMKDCLAFFALRYNRTFLFFMAFTSCMACDGMAALFQTSPKSGQSAPAAMPDRKTTYNVTHFPSAAAALQEVMRRQDPQIIGIGEIHQTLDTRQIPSALNRFTQEFMPAIAHEVSDIVVETWQPLGCGAEAKEIVTQVKEVIERPEVTETEVVTLLKKAKSLGIQPHILKVDCEEYATLFMNDGGTFDAYLMLKLITRLLRKKTEAVLTYRERTQSRSKDDALFKSKEGKRILVYGGALHNNPHPEEGWEEVTFGPALRHITGGKYVAVDLYVPEYVVTDTDNTKALWYPTFKKHVSTRQVTLIEISQGEYHLVLKKQERNGTTVPSPQKLGEGSQGFIVP